MSPPETPLLDAVIRELTVADPDSLRELAGRLAPHLPASMPSHMLTAGEKSRQLGGRPCAETLERWARSGRVPGAKQIGRVWRFPIDCEILPAPAGVAAEPHSRPRRRRRSERPASIAAIRDPVAIDGR